MSELLLWFLQLVCFNNVVQVYIITPINCFGKSFINSSDQLGTMVFFPFYNMTYEI